MAEFTYTSLVLSNENALFIHATTDVASRTQVRVGSQ